MPATAREHATSNCCVYLMFASIFATETNIQCVKFLSLSLSFLSQIKINRPHMTTYNSLAADRYGKETGLRAKSPSWNDLRCLTKGREGPALDGAYLSGCQVFKLPRSGCIPELGINKIFVQTTCDNILHFCMLVVQTRTVVILTQEQVSKHNMSIHVLECY